MENAKIAKKLVAVMSECSHVGKNGLNSYHQYKYATAEDVLCKVNEALTKNKLASVVTPALDSVVDVLKTLITGAKESLRMRLMALAEVFMYCLCLKDHRQLSKSLIA